MNREKRDQHETKERRHRYNIKFGSVIEIIPSPDVQVLMPDMDTRRVVLQIDKHSVEASTITLEGTEQERLENPGTEGIDEIKSVISDEPWDFNRVVLARARKRYGPHAIISEEQLVEIGKLLEREKGKSLTLIR